MTIVNVQHKEWASKCQEKIYYKVHELALLKLSEDQLGAATWRAQGKAPIKKQWQGWPPGLPAVWRWRRT